MPDSVAVSTPACPSAQAPPGARLLLIGGAPGSGKSELARCLAVRYHAQLCSKDEIKEILFDTLGTPEGRDPAAWSRRLSDASFALLFAFARRLLRAGRPLLLEGNFRPGEHETALAARLGAAGPAPAAAHLAQVLCHARAATLASRLAARAHDPHRHPGHRDAQLAAASASRAVVGFLDLPGPRLQFDSEAPRETTLAALYQALDPWMADA
jgi:predicted kinase